MADNTRILLCTCRHEFQDRIYGIGMRVHNVMAGGGERCTVCGNMTQKRAVVKKA